MPVHDFWFPAYSIYSPVKNHEDGDMGRMKHVEHRSCEQGIWGYGSQGDSLSRSVEKIEAVVHTKTHVDALSAVLNMWRHRMCRIARS